MKDQKLSGKIALGLERISDAYRSMLAQEAIRTGLSPIQLRILIFISTHSPALRNVTSIAGEYHLTKPTISDAVKTLEGKRLIFKKPSVRDSRSFEIHLTDKGRKIVQAVHNYHNPIADILSNLPEPDLESLYISISKLISDLHKTNNLKVQRTCFACKFYKGQEEHFCQFLNTSLLNSEIRLDCSLFEPVV